MKKITVLTLILLILFCGCSDEKINDDFSKESTEKSSESVVKAVWINYNELAMKNEKENTAEVFGIKAEEMMRNCAEFGFNRVIVQVRPFCDAFYDSDFFPATEYLSGTQGVYCGYDALEILCDTAHKYGLKTDAWINPYRVSYKTDINVLSDNNIAKSWYFSEDKNRNVIVLNNGIYLNPSKDDVHKLILDGVREIIGKYDVDGIHLDDYFYPTCEVSFDSPEYDFYVSSGGKLSLESWRTENINALISDIYTELKNKSPDMILSISPSGNIEKNKENYYADVSFWCENEGYIDLIMPQLYYGFDNSAKPFEESLAQWENLVRCDSVSLCIGLAVYKYGKEDKYAGAGINEWMKNSNIISKQISLIKETDKNTGVALYSYSYLFSENTFLTDKDELQSIKNMLQ